MSDVLVRAMLNEEVAVYACDVSTMVELARQTHDTMPVGTIIMGRTLAATAMLCAVLKNESDRLTMIINGGGPAGTIMAVGNAALRIKATIGNPGVNPPPSPKGGFDIAAGVGTKGSITVIRDTGLKEPYTGTVPLVSGEIGEDVAQYLFTSEQQPSIVYVNTWLETDMSVVNAGGLMLRPMPGCSEQTLQEVEQRIGDINNFAVYLFQYGVEGVLNKIFQGMHLKILDTQQPVYECDCSKERLEHVVVSLGEREINDMIKKDDGAEITCHFCNTIYQFDAEELEKLLLHAKRKNKE